MIGEVWLHLAEGIMEGFTNVVLVEPGLAEGFWTGRGEKGSHKPSLGGREAEVCWERGNILCLRNSAEEGGCQVIAHLSGGFIQTASD